MREIKFRVWNIEEMGEVIRVDWFQKRVVYLRKNDKEMFSTYFTDCELMQYTGLKDKNGVEIYEGDIVRYEDKKFYVSYDSGIASFILANDDWEDFCHLTSSDSKKMEVIGNIYENKELLEG